MDYNISAGERDIVKKLFPGSNHNSINHQREMTVLKVTKPDHINVPAATILKIPTSKSPLQQHLMSPLVGNSLLTKPSVPVRSEVMSSVQSAVTTSSSIDTRTPVTQLLARTLEKRQKQQQSAIVTGKLLSRGHLWWIHNRMIGKFNILLSHRNRFINVVPSSAVFNYSWMLENYLFIT